MASLIEELISTLTEEEALYQEMIPVSEEKTRVIVANDLEALQTVTEKEQVMVDKVGALEKKRMETVKNIGIVLSRNPETLTLHSIVEMLHNQPEEQQKLRAIHDKLRVTTGRLKDINSQNKLLIEESLEMIEFNMNVLRSTRMSSGSSNYTRNASQTSSAAAEPGMFDAKQ